MPRLPLLLCLVLISPLPAVHAADADIVINEIHYHPDNDDPRVQFVELYNRGPDSVDLSGWYFSSGITYTVPNGFVLAADSYVAVAADPFKLNQAYGAVGLLGPFTGTLDNGGERIDLRNASGGLIDSVRYDDRPDWPVSPDGSGASLELCNPFRMNSLPDNWRGAGSRPPEPQWQLFTFSGPGTTDPQSRFYIYLLGAGELLVDEVEVVRVGSATNSIGDGRFDDGMGLWQVVGNHSTSAIESEDTHLGEGALHLVSTGAGGSTAGSLKQEPMFEAVAAGQIYSVTMWVKFLTPGVTLEARMGGSTYGVSGCAGRITGAALVNALATPGARNTQRTDNLPPFISSVSHVPHAPRSTDSVVVRCNITDDSGPIAAATLEVQDNPPGGYIRISDPGYQNWTVLPLRDDGQSPDFMAGDGSFAGTIPPHPHRHLVRYRVQAEDGQGKVEFSPYLDDPQPNHAYYVYDGTGHATIPTYTMIGAASDFYEAQFNGIYSNEYKWRVSLYYEGDVYDHVWMRLRGGTAHRFHFPKRSWRLKLLNGHHFQGHDNQNAPFPYERSRINLVNEHYPPGRIRGDTGVTEWIAYELFRRVGVMAWQVTFSQLKIVDSPVEFDQYNGDWFGTFKEIEAPNENALERLGRPIGTLYKVDNESSSVFDKHTLDWDTDQSDVLAFRAAYRGFPNQAWFENNLRIDTYISYRAVGELLRHYDLTYKNYYYYHNPSTNRWEEAPWDVDHVMTAQSLTNSNNGYLWQAFKAVPALYQEYLNRLRELYQLMFTPEYMFPMLDEKQAFLSEIAAADRWRWDYAPLTNRIGGTTPLEMQPAHGQYKSLEERIDDTKTWILNRRTELLPMVQDSQMPAAPSLLPVLDAHPDRIVLRSDPFSDPNGGDSFAGARFMIIADGGDYLFPLWDSGMIAPGTTEMAVPGGILAGNTTYKWRARHGDPTNRWGWWSPEGVFTTSAVTPTPTPTPSPTPSPTPTPVPGANQPPRWFLPDLLSYGPTPRHYDRALQVRSFVEDDFTSSSQLQLALLDQSNTTALMAQLESDGWLGVEVRGPGRSVLTLRARDAAGLDSVSQLEIVVSGPSAVPPSHWAHYR